MGIRGVGAFYYIAMGIDEAGGMPRPLLPMVLDAIRNRGQNTFECYFRRHENISCNGKIDYDAPSSPKRVAEVQSEEMPLSPAPKKKRKHISEKTDTEEPSLIGRVSKGIKNLFGGGEN